MRTIKRFNTRTLIAGAALASAIVCTAVNGAAAGMSVREGAAGAAAAPSAAPSVAAAVQTPGGGTARLADGTERRESAISRLFGAESVRGGDDADEGGIINILLIGTDELLPDSDDLGRGDVTMLCSLDRESGSVKLVSFERSTAVPWQGHGDVMLTNSFTYGGAELTTESIRRCFRVDVAGYVHFDFDSFSRIIDALGGIDVELTAAEAAALTEDTYTEIWFSEGMNRLDGEGALRLCRLRRIDDNWERVARQRRVVQAVLTRAKSLRLTQIDDIAAAVLPLIDTDLPARQLASLLLAAPKFAGAQAEQMTIPDRSSIWVHDGYDEDVTGCDYGYESERLRVFLYGE